MRAGRVKSSLVAVWLVASTVLLSALVTPFLLSPEALALLAPQCPLQLSTGRACAACALANSLLLIPSGKLNAAVNQSELGLPLYAALVWNECLTFLYTANELRRFWGRLRRSRRRSQTEEYSCRL